MRKSIVTKVFISTMVILLITLSIQLVVQMYFMDDIYRIIKTREMESAFEALTEEIEESIGDANGINELTIDYAEDETAPVLLLDNENQIVNDAFFESLNYVSVETSDKSYKVLLGDRVDEEGHIVPAYNEFALGNTVSVTGGLLKGHNVMILDGQMNNELVTGYQTIEGIVTDLHFIKKDSGIFSDQSSKLLREVSYALNDPIEGESSFDFFEVETGLILTIQIQQLSDGMRVFSLYTMEDLSQTFVVINKYYGYLFIMQMGLLILLTSIYSKWITKPIKRLINEAKRIATLDFSTHEKVKTGDELEELSNSLKSISDSMSCNMALLKKDAEEKAASEKRMRELLANLSHEFKTPLGIMSGFLEMMAVSDENKSYYIATIEEEVDRLNELTKETLLLCESENHSVYNLSERNSLTVLCKTGKFLDQIQDENLTLEETIVDRQVEGDGRKIQLVFDNLMSNAIKYTPAGGTIRLSMKDVEDKVYIYLQNTGVTFDEDDMTKVWDKYYRREKSRNKEHGGNGLGLSIVRNILEHHGSDYGVYNEENAVVFYFSLKKIK